MEKAFTFPRTEEEFVLWRGNMTEFLTLIIVKDGTVTVFLQL